MTTRFKDSGVGQSLPAKDSLARLVDRLLSTAERAAAQGAWDEVEEIVADVLAVAPEEQRAADLLWLARAQQSLLGGERALVTLLFSDIVRSIDMAESAEPETIRDVFRIYRDVATDATDALGGSVLQFQHDGFVASFGDPKAHGDDAQRAVLAGLEIVDRMARVGPDIRRRLGVEAPVRVGIHSGMVVAGLASGVGGTPDVVGAATNMAVHLQVLAEPGTVVISDATRPLVEGSFELSPLGRWELKGIARPVEVFRVLRARPAAAHLDAVKLHSAALVGREAAQLRLRGWWDETVRTCGRGDAPGRTMVVLRGAAGIGKSRVAGDLCDYAIAQGGTGLRTECSPYHTNVALWPVARLFEDQLGLNAQQTVEERIAILRRTVEEVGLDLSAVPAVAAMLGLDSPGDPEASELDPLVRRARMMKTIVQWVAHFAARRPTLTVFDNLQWADPTTVELLGMCVQERIPGLMIVVGSREPVPEVWAGLAPEIYLQPLGEEAALALAREIARGADLDDTKMREIVDRSDGIPLFVEELARNAANERRPGHLPLRLRELLAARLRAPGIDLRIAQLAATLGPVFDRALLAELAGTSIDRALADLEEAGIVKRQGDPRQRIYQFSHVLLRDAAYETQVLEVRKETHRRIARLLQAVPRRSPGDTALIAQHHDLAGDVAEAVMAYLEAAQEAQTSASHLEARRLLTRVFELLHDTSEGEGHDLTELTTRLLRAVSIASVLGYSPPRSQDAWDSRSSSPEELSRAGNVLKAAWSGFMNRAPGVAVSPYWGLPNDSFSATGIALACAAALHGRTAEGEEWERRVIEPA